MRERLPRPAPLTVLGLCGLVLSGCSGHTVVVRDDEAGIELEYVCSGVRPAAVTPAERAAVRSRAISLIRVAEAAGDHEVVNAMISATAHPDARELERELARRLCSDADLRAAVLGAPPRRAQPPWGPDEIAPSLALPLLGRPDRDEPDSLRLENLRGRYVYLDVFGSWCAPCRTKYPAMAEMARRLESEGEDLAVVGLLLRDDPDRASAFLAEHGGAAYPFAVLDEETARRWGITGAPMGFLVSPEGRIIRRCFGCQRGPLSTSELPDYVTSLAAAG